MAKVNKNESPIRTIREIKNEVKWDEYEYSSLFTHYCDVEPNFDNERLEIVHIHEYNLVDVKGIVYVLVVENRIIKMGQSINEFSSRLGSYNSGKMAYRARGTNSGANFFMLQSLLNIKKQVNVYLLAPNHKKWEVLGETGTEPFPPAKIWERILLNKFKSKYGKLPIGNTQK